MSKQEMVQFIQEMEQMFDELETTEEFIEMVYHYIMSKTEEWVQKSYHVSNQKRIKEEDVRFVETLGR